MYNKYLADIMTYLSQKQNTADVSAATAVSSFYYMSKINLQHGKLTVENRKSIEKKTDTLRSIGKQSQESVGTG